MKTLHRKHCALVKGASTKQACKSLRRLESYLRLDGMGSLYRKIVEHCFGRMHSERFQQRGRNLNPLPRRALGTLYLPINAPARLLSIHLTAIWLWLAFTLLPLGLARWLLEQRSVPDVGSSSDPPEFTFVGMQTLHTRSTISQSGRLRNKSKGVPAAGPKLEPSASAGT